MDNARRLNRVLATTAWGALLIWWGITLLFSVLPAGSGALGTGLILLGLNAARSLNRLPTRSLSVTLGILALVWGSLDLLRALSAVPPDLPVFAILVIVLGVIVLGRELLRVRRTGYTDWVRGERG